jgi:hypothetical protein
MTLRETAAAARDRTVDYVRLLRREVEPQGPIRVIWLIGTIMPVVLWIGGELGPLESPLELVDSRNPLVELPGALLLTYAGMAVLSLVVLVVIVETARRLRRCSKR